MEDTSKKKATVYMKGGVMYLPSIPVVDEILVNKYTLGKLKNTDKDTLTLNLTDNGSIDLASHEVIDNVTTIENEAFLFTLNASKPSSLNLVEGDVMEIASFYL